MKLLIYFCLSLPCIYCTDTTSNLKLVQLYFRHGSRAPREDELYPNYVLEDNYLADIKYGQLTTQGKRQMYHLGILLRERYDNFLQSNNPSEIVFTKTTDVDRTKMSALLVLAGLFPPNTSERLEPSLNWTPLPYHYEQFEKDYEFGLPYDICPAYKQECQRLASSEEVQQYLQSHKDIFEYIQNHTGKVMASLEDVHDLDQGLSALTAMNASLPEWATSIYPQPIENIALQYLKYNNYNTLLKRFNGGLAIKTAVENMLACTSSSIKTTKEKIYVNSVHDTNVAAIMGILNMLNRFPRYGSTVLLELHNSVENEYFVKVFYLEHPYSDFEELSLPDCGINCPLEHFINITSPYFPSNIEKECLL